MKRIIIMLIPLFSIVAAYGQAEMDALRFGQKDLLGTARYMGMGGAFNALGGDASAIANNPAGLGIYRSSEVTFTGNLSVNTTDMRSVSESVNNSKWHFNMNNFGLVIALPSYNNQALKYSNFAVTFNRLKNFHRNKDYNTQYATNSLLHSVSNGYQSDAMFDLMWDLYMVDEGTDINGNKYIHPFSDHSRDNNMLMTEKGSLNEWNFSYGGNINDIVYFGLGLGVRSLDYRIRTDYYEEYYNANNEVDGNMTLQNAWEVDASGFNFKVGVIVRPLDFMRVGASFQTPTFYNGRDSYATDAYSNRYYPAQDETKHYYDYGDWYDYNYDMRTPLTVNAGLAFIIGQKGILSADYELEDYSRMKFEGLSFSTMNDYIKEDMQAQHTIRVGGEYRVTDKFNVRLGYALSTSPVKSAVEKDEKLVYVVDKFPHYSIPKTNSYYSAGLGFRGDHFFFDAAYVLNMRKNHFYAYDMADRVVDKSNTSNIVCTLGWRF